MPGIGHSGFPRGKKVRIVMLDGRVIDCRFYERNDTYIFIDDGKTKFRKEEIRRIFIHRERNGKVAA